MSSSLKFLCYEVIIHNNISINICPATLIEKHNILKHANDLALKKDCNCFLHYNLLFNSSKKYLITNNITIKNIDWEIISCSNSMLESFIEKYKNEVNWDEILSNKKLSEDFIRKILITPSFKERPFGPQERDDIPWDTMSLYQELSEDFIREFQDDVDWGHISYNRDRELSEDFIRKFQDNHMENR